MLRIIVLIQINSFFIAHFLVAQDSLAITYGKGIDANELRSIIYQLASDDFEGRATGDEGQRKAAKYISDYYFNCGILPYNKENYYQSFNLKRIQYQSTQFILLGDTLKEGKDFLCYNPRSSKTFENITTSWLGYLKDYASNLESQQSTVLIAFDSLLSASGSENNLRLSMSSVRKYEERNRGKKTEAILIVSNNIENYHKKITAYYTKGPLMYQIDSTEIPIVIISEATADRILAPSKIRVQKWKTCKDKGKKVKPVSKSNAISLRINSVIENVETQNVLAYIEGTDLKEELVIISGHYDHLGKTDNKIYYGADDNGTGTAGIMTIGKAMNNAKINGHGPKRSILILNCTAEEIGLLGSRYYTSNPVFPLENTIVNLNIDMIGRNDEKHTGNSDYVYIIGADKLSSQLDSITSSVNDIYTGIELDYTFNQPDDPNRFYYRSDHYNFARKNIPCAFYFSGVHEDYHKPGDTADKIDIYKVEKITKLVFYTAWELANMPTRIIVDKQSDESRN